MSEIYPAYLHKVFTYMIMEAWISQDFLQIVPFSAQIVQNNL